MESENTELKLDKTGEDESEDKSDKEKDGDKSDKGKDEDKDKSDNSDDKPTIKLASFSTMSTSTENGHSEENEDGCYSCSKLITNIFEAIVWETMQFCDETCLANYQSGMSNCASCKKEVQSSSLGKYCVRFGCDIKQFCSNVCLEDYKKGLKVCSYCQKDISGGEGFLAPIGDKGQFKDFCDGGCLKKYEHIFLGKAPEPETLPCNVCKEACQLCQKHFDDSMDIPTIHYEGTSVVFCSKPCQNVFIMQKRKIVPCVYCKVKKYNFDMIEKFPEGATTNSNLYCSLTCLTTHATHQAKFPGVFPSSLPVISAVSSLATPGTPPLL